MNSKMDLTNHKWYIRNNKLHICENEIFNDSEYKEEIKSFMEGNLENSEWYNVKGCPMAINERRTVIKYYGPFSDSLIILDNKNKVK